MAVTIYTHHDAAGPGLSLTGNNLAKFLQILVPCLVNGYTGKPAAGWTLEQNIASGFSLSRASGGAVNFTKTSNTNGLQLYLLESISSITTSPPTGQNLRSLRYSASSNATEGNRQWLRLTDSASIQGWFVAATPEAFILHIRTTTSVSDTSDNESLTLFCGSAKLFSPLSGVQNMMALSGSDYGASTVSEVYNYLFEQGYTTLRDPISGTVVTGAGLVLYGSPAYMQQSRYGLAPPDNWPDKLRLNPLNMIYGASFVGFVPGVLFDAVVGHFQAGGLMSALGWTPSVEAWRSPKVIDGHNVWPLPTQWGLLLVTDDATYWPG